MRRVKAQTIQQRQLGIQRNQQRQLGIQRNQQRQHMRQVKAQIIQL